MVSWWSRSAEMRWIARAFVPSTTTASRPTAAPILTPTGRLANQPPGRRVVLRDIRVSSTRVLPRGAAVPFWTAAELLGPQCR